MCGTQLASAAPLMKKKTATAERDQRRVILQLETSRTSIDSSDCLTTNPRAAPACRTA